MGIWILIAGLVLLCAGCGGARAEQSSAVPAERTATGHARMLDLLDGVAAKARESPFVGETELHELRARLAALPQGVPDPKRWMLHKLLGGHEQRLGNLEQAIHHYQQAYRQIEVFRGEIPLEKAMETTFDLGVAYLRLSATQNCVERHTANSCILPIQSDAVHHLQHASHQAVRYLTEVLANTPHNTPLGVKAKWLLNISYMTLGGWPEAVPETYRIPPAAFGSDEAFPRFRDIAPRLGLNSYDLAGGAVAEDFDGDGFLDIMVSTSNPSGQMRLYRNKRDGTFSEQTEKAGLKGLRGGLNMIQADYDNDGNTDVLVLRGAWLRQHGAQPNSLLRNNGDGTFSDVTFEAGLGLVHYPTQTAAWADFDNDGDLDLYIGNETSRDMRSPCQLFRNNGNGTFTDMAARAGVENLRFTKAVVWGDYDGDRFPDLYVSNMGHANRLYHNNGDGTFTDVAEQSGVTHPISSFPSWFWDIDNDGALDLFVAGYGGADVPANLAEVAAGYVGLQSRSERACLYRGNGAGGFDDVAVEWNLTRVTLPMGANFGDLDNDGFPDFFLGTGYPFFEGLMPNMMYRNRGGTGFSDVTTNGGFGLLQKGHGIVFADLDHDGDQDVYEQMGGAYPGDAYGNVLFENPGFGNHWIKLELIGVRSNRSAIGARIRVEVIEDGERRSIYKHVNSGGSFGAKPLRQEIGLGQAEKIKLLEIYWPTSDLTQRFEGVATDQLIEVTEGASAYRQVSLKETPFGS